MSEAAQTGLRPGSAHPVMARRIQVVSTGNPGKPLAPQRPAERTVTVAIQASDPIIGLGTAAYLRTCPGIMPVPVTHLQDADVVLAMATVVTETTLSRMCRAAEDAAPRRLGFVLVGDGIRAPQLLRAVTCGVVTVMPWEGNDYQQIVDAIRHVYEGRADLPGTMLSSMISRILALQASNAGRAGLMLHERETDVLRLLADGLSTAEIARRLNYSERTVKSIIHGVISRLNLRNRSHAVAFAIRNDLL